ncbi:MAG TPA: hypothetical protein VF303_04300 [Candidatus Nanoarchaeia archaeon]
MRSTVVEFFAHQLNTDPDIFGEVIDALEHITDKKKVLEHFYTENQEKVRKILSDLKLTYPTAEQVYETVGKNVKKLDKKIYELLDRPQCISNESCANLISAVLALNTNRTGFFLKRKVAESLLRENPPKKIMAELGYKNVEEMIEREDLFEIYAALRFIEKREWLNSTYIAAYRELKKDDFEVRAIEIRVLDINKWKKITEAFVGKKLHPMSHLKELGLIFLVPSEELKDASTTYLFAMTSHYLDEVTLYSNYLKYHSEDEFFGEKIVSAIRGDVPTAVLSKGQPNLWLVIQRYLFKEDPNDVRLGIPHINPEALYHRGASRTLLKMAKFVPALHLLIWEHTNYVAVWFPTRTGKEELVNFNFMDNIMSVMNKRKLKDRYTYHFHEALWNKIFINYFGVEKMEDVIVKNLLNGWFDIRKI